MAEISGANYVSPGLSYFVKRDGPQLGAYMPDKGDLTVYWRGRVARGDVCSIIEEAEIALARAGEKVKGTIDAYGIDTDGEADDTSERHIGPVSKDLFKFLAPTSEIPA